MRAQPRRMANVAPSKRRKPSVQIGGTRPPRDVHLDDHQHSTSGGEQDDTDSIGTDDADQDQVLVGPLPDAAVPTGDGVLASSDAPALLLQISALLSETQIDYAREGALINKCVEQLRNALASMPRCEVTGASIPGFVQELGVPAEETMWVGPPSSVSLVGSYATSTGVRPGGIVDVAVEMPSNSLFQKAHLNHRYHARRAMYLCAVSSHLSGTVLHSGTASVAAQATQSFKRQRLEDGKGSKAAGAAKAGSEEVSVGGDGGSVGARPFQQQISFVDDDPRKPALLLTPLLPLQPRSVSSAVGHKPAGAAQTPATFQLRLLISAPADAIATVKLAPDRNSVRAYVKANSAAQSSQSAGSTGATGAGTGATVNGAVLNGHSATAGSQGSGPAPLSAAAAEAALLPTPQYNASILQDLMLVQHAQYVRSVLAKSPRLADVVQLLKVWARRHGLSSGSDGLPSTLLVLLVVHLAETGKLAPAMSILQMLRAVLQTLAEPAGLSKGLAMRHTPSAAPAMPPIPPSHKSFRKQYAVVFIDFSGWLNVAARMSVSSLAQIVSAASRTLALLQRPVDPEEAFHAAFLTSYGHAAAFDYHWRVLLPPTFRDHSSQPRDTVAWREEEERAEALVRRALSDRAHLVRASRRAPSLTPPNSTTPNPTSAPSHSTVSAQLSVAVPHPASDEIWISARLDATAALRLVDVGPAADDVAAAAKFRAFWGSAAELRRFQDGKISEAVVWAAGLADRHTIPDKIVQYALARHLPGCTMTGSSGALDVMMQRKNSTADEGVVAARALDAALDKLTKQLRTLSTLALKVVAVQPVSGASRGTAAFPPLPHPLAGGPPESADHALPRCMVPVEILVTLEGSGKWPDDSMAFRKMRSALGVQLAGALASAFGIRSSCSEEAVDVLADGFAFRLLVHSGREDAALAAGVAHAAPIAITKSASITAPDTTAAAAAPSATLELAPRAAAVHHGLIAGLAGTNPAFAPTCRLANRWVASQLLSNHLSEQAVELLVAAVYSGPSVAPPPASRLTGFLRFLHLLSQHPWAHRPLIVDPAAELNEVARRSVLRRFEERRSSKQTPSLYIVTPTDLLSANWTHERPTSAVLRHIVTLAAAAGAQVTNLLSSSTLFSRDAQLSSQASATGGKVNDHAAAWQSIWQSPWDQFDALLLLRKEASPLADCMIGRQHATERRIQPDVLTEALEGGPEAPPKSARVFLRAFPEQVVEGKGPDKLLPELLVGFDPIRRLVSLLEERYGHLATFCLDSLGGSAIGVKWHPAAFLAAPTTVVSAHTALSCGLTIAGGSAPGAPCVPNIMQILTEWRLMGEGLVKDVHLMP